MTKSRKFLIETGIILTAISLKAKSAGRGLKEYLYEEETTKHISLVLYDLLPLSVKIGMRYEKFHEIFHKNFSAIRDALLGKEIKEEKVTDEKVLEVIKEEKKVSKKTTKKAPTKTRVKKVKEENEVKYIIISFRFITWFFLCK